MQKILMNDNLIGYPIEDYLYQLKNDQVVSIVNELLELIIHKQRGVDDYRNFEEFLKGTFGNTLYQLYFGPYNTKIWNTDLGKVPLDWLEGKLPMPQIHNILLNNILKKEESAMVHASFFYPKFNGSQFIIKQACRKNKRSRHRSMSKE